MTDQDPPEQLGFDFAAAPGTSPSGYDRWQAERRQALEGLARQLGLPLGHQAEVRLRDGVVLRGLLALAEDELFIAGRRDFDLLLRVDRCTFKPNEIESCVRL